MRDGAVWTYSTEEVSRLDFDGLYDGGLVI